MEVKITDSVLEKIRMYINCTTLHKLHEIVDIRYVADLKKYDITYVASKYFDYSKTITFSTANIHLDLKPEIRECIIDDILATKEVETDFDVEDVIYTPAQRERLSELRKKVTCSDRLRTTFALRKAKREYSESFSVGQKVHYNNHNAVITFKHKEKDGYETQRWTVKVSGVEYRYVSGMELYNRVVEDMSHIEIDEKLNKLPTDKLLKMMKWKRRFTKGVADVKIKRILQERENIE